MKAQELVKQIEREERLKQGKETAQDIIDSTPILFSQEINNFYNLEKLTR